MSQSVGWDSRVWFPVQTHMFFFATSCRLIVAHTPHAW